MLTFNEEKHEYRFNNEIVPSVTQIISELNDLSSIPEHVLKNKGELGTEFHRIIKLHFLDDLLYDTIDSRLVPAFNTFLNWSNPRIDEFRKGLSEHRMYNEKMCLAGTCDLALPGELYDWKLRGTNPIVDILQLEAYDFLLGGCKRKRWTMCFDMKSGKLRQVRSDHSQSYSMFMHMLDYHHSDNKDEKKHLQLLDSWRGEFN
jgi:hypothetical protein